MRWVKRLTVAVILAVVTVVTIWLIAGPRLVEGMAVALLRDAGLPIDRLRVERLGLSRAVLTDISLGDGAIRANTIALRYDALRLASDLRLDAITVSGLQVEMEVDAAGRVLVSGLTGGGGTETDTTLPALPFDRLEADDLSLTVATPFGTVGVRGVAHVEPVDIGPGLRIGGSLEVATRWGVAAVDPTFTIDTAGAVTGGALIASAALEPLAGVRAAQIDAWAHLEASRTNRFSTGIRVGLLAGDGWDVRDLMVTVRGQRGRPDWISIRGVAEPGAVNVAIDVAPHDGGLLVAADLDAARLDAVASAFGGAGLGGGRISAQADLTLMADLLDLTADDLVQGPVSGRLAITGTDLVVEGGTRLDTVSVAADGHWDGRRVVVTGVAPWTVRGHVPGFGPVALTVDGDMTNGPQQVRIDPADGVAVEATGRLTGTAGDIDGDAWFDVSMADLATLGPRLRSGVLDVVRLQATGFGWGLRTLAPVRLRARGDATSAQLGVRGALRAAPLVPGPVDAVSVDLDGTLTWQDGTLAATVAGCRPVQVTVAEQDGLSLAAPVDTCVSAPNGPVLTILPDGTWAASAGLGAVDVVGAVDGETFALQAGPEQIDVRVAADTQVIVGRDIDLSLPTLGADLASAELTITGNSDASLALDLGGGLLSLRGRPQPLVPLWVTGRVDYGPAGALSGTVSGVGAGGSLQIGGTVRGTLASGSFGFRAGPVTLSADGVQMEDLVPAAAAGPLVAAQGQIAVQGRYGWGGGSADFAEIQIADLDIATPDVTAIGVNGTLRVSDFDPLTVPLGQTLTADLVDVVIALRNGRMAFGLRDDDVMSVEDVRFEWAGGVLRAEPFEAGLDDREWVLALAADDVSLGQVLGLLGVDDLEAEGQLTGRVPLRLVDDTIAIQGGLLAATAPGVIRYRPAQPPLPEDEEGVALLLEALENFHYDGLSLSLDGQSGGDLTAVLRVRGSNPDVLDGYPIALTVNVTGALDRLIEQGLVGTTLIDTVRGRLEDEASDPREPLWDAIRRLQ